MGYQELLTGRGATVFRDLAGLVGATTGLPLSPVVNMATGAAQMQRAGVPRAPGMDDASSSEDLRLARGAVDALGGATALVGPAGVAPHAAVLSNVMEVQQGAVNRHRGDSYNQPGRLPSDEPAAVGTFQLLHGGAGTSAALERAATPRGAPPSPTELVARAAQLGLSVGNAVVHGAEVVSSQSGEYGQDQSGQNIDSSTAAANTGMEARQWLGQRVSEGWADAGGKAVTVGTAILNTFATWGRSLVEGDYTGTTVDEGARVNCPVEIHRATDPSRAQKIDQAAMTRAAQEVFQAGAGRLGTNEEAMLRALEGRSANEMAEIRRIYRQQHGRDLWDDLNGELSGQDLDRAMAAYRGSTAARRQPAPSCRDIDRLSSETSGASGVQASVWALAQSVGLRPAQLARLQEACAGREGQTPTDDAR